MFDPWSGKIPWRRKWQPTPVVLPGKSHGQRSLVDYIAHGVTKVTTEWLTSNNNMDLAVCKVVGFFSAEVQPRLIQGIRRGDGFGEDQDAIASIRY